MTSVFKELTLNLEKTERLDKVLTDKLGLSRSTIQSWLKVGLVSVNGAFVHNSNFFHFGLLYSEKRPLCTWINSSNSFGGSTSKFNFSPVTGCVKLSVFACKN